MQETDERLPHAGLPGAKPALPLMHEHSGGWLGSVALHLAGAAALGLLVLYGVGFAESPSLHNPAHDARHTTRMPCH